MAAQTERRVARIERLLEQVQEELTRLRAELGVPVSADERWGRMMLGVLEEIEARGGLVPREEVLSIGERHGYNRRGMAGFYQGMLQLESGVAKLTEAGVARLKRLQEYYGKTEDPINQEEKS